jgi:hypothetical protein
MIVFQSSLRDFALTAFVFPALKRWARVMASLRDELENLRHRRLELWVTASVKRLACTPPAAAKGR